MADIKHIEQLKHSVKRWNRWRENHPDIQIDLSGAYLSYANLLGANLASTIFAHVDLRTTQGLVEFHHLHPSIV